MIKIALFCLLYFGLPQHLYSKKFFVRVSTFPVCKQLESTCNTDIAINAESVTATSDGKTLIYSSGLDKTIGFIDISDPSVPLPKGYVNAGGEPKAVAALGSKYILACINTSSDFINVSGKLIVISVSTKAIVATFNLYGQPSAMKISNDGKYAVITIANERNKSLNSGNMPQLPPGYVVVVDINSSSPQPQTSWTLTTIAVAGLPGLDFPSDPEPRSVDINDNNVAAITLPVNNAIVLIDCKKKSVFNSFTAGSTSISMVDVLSNKLIENTGTRAANREPDGVAWIDNCHIVTADRGDFKGGTRTFTIFDFYDGSIEFSSGNELDMIATKYGAYPELNSARGNEVREIHCYFCKNV
jgi:hypothetical protein